MTLKAPYYPIYSVGMNTYSYLKLDGLPYAFLSTTSIEDMSVEKQFMFFKWSKKKDLLVAHKLMPLNSMVLFILIQAQLLNEVTYELDVEGNKLPVYAVWDDMAVAEVKHSFKKSVLDVVDKHNYSFPVTIKNPVAKGFIKDGFEFFALETPTSLERTYWLVRTNKFGNLHIVEVSERGTLDDSLTTSVIHQHLDRNLINIIVDDFKNGRILEHKGDK